MLVCKTCSIWISILTRMLRVPAWHSNLVLAGAFCSLISCYVCRKAQGEANERGKTLKLKHRHLAMFMIESILVIRPLPSSFLYCFSWCEARCLDFVWTLFLLCTAFPGRTNERVKNRKWLICVKEVRYQPLFMFSSLLSPCGNIYISTLLFSSSRIRMGPCWPTGYISISRARHFRCLPYPDSFRGGEGVGWAMKGPPHILSPL